MKIPQAQERDQIELDLPIRLRLDAIAHPDGISLPQELDFLGDFDPLQLIFEANKTVEPKTSKVLLSMRMKRLAELIDRQLEKRSIAIQINQLPNSIERIHPSQRRHRRRRQQPVIPPRIAAHQRGRRKRADAVGQEPFVGEERMEITVASEGATRQAFTFRGWP